MKRGTKRRAKGRYNWAQAAGFAYRGARALIRTKRQRTGEIPSVTNQFDQKTIYRKRRVNRRRLRRKRKAFRRFTGLFLKTLGCNQFVKTNSAEYVAALNQQQVAGFVFLGAGISTPNTDFNLIKNAVQTSGTAANWRRNETIYFKKGVCDITMYNQTAGVTADIDVYLVRLRKNCSVDTSVEGCFNTTVTSEQKPDGSGATTLSSTMMGVTPFQAPQFCQYYTILNKKKYLLSTDQTAHFQIKQGFKCMNLENNSDAYMFRGTIGVLIIFNGVWKSSAAGFPSCTLSVSYTRTYNVKYLAEGDDRAGTI